MSFLQQIPAKVRAAIYTILALVGLVLGAIQVYDSATGAVQPDWLTGALAVYAFVSGALGFTTARANTDTSGEG